MNYNKINKIINDGDGNIVIQDVNTNTITVNYNDTEAMMKVFQSISDVQTFEIKQLLGNQHSDVIAEISKIQLKLDELNTEKQVKEATEGLDEFMLELKEASIKAIKKRLKDGYEMLREYQDLYAVESDPMLKKRYILQISNVKTNISSDMEELKNI